ncbi:hypothetical protein CEUSTIGMA_g6797.t1 [Chlamydomonas eustigma]|uniref:Uncharacterized protein n=1 Tax=Chlamydomonas eustigma TaxID=1157962 RepID=A0A250X8F8_9CHLO|nr:hypothetical protein CEUSTIGMA_g6797.t1 [Chlamydomonas eustigma]|eukprot:GAX79355.1 hypothetical protein CEUSTIGMA_g6797.t1 [Chlamydomonas eustigma]
MTSGHCDSAEWPQGTSIRICRICLEEDSHDDDSEVMIQPCACKGSHGWVHRQCLRTWRRSGHNASVSSRCPVCAMDYDRDALDTVSCSSTASHFEREEEASSRRAATLALLSASLEQQALRAYPVDQMSLERRWDQIHSSISHPRPNVAVSIFGTFGILVLIATLLGWIKGDHDIRVWLRSTLLTVIVLCCAPIAILHTALKAASDSLQGLGYHWRRQLQGLLSLMAWLITAGVMGICLILPASVGEESAWPYEAGIAAVAFPATCYSHYQMVRKQRQEWEAERLETALNDEEGQLGRREALQLWQQQQQRQRLAAAAAVAAARVPSTLPGPDQTHQLAPSNRSLPPALASPLLQQAAPSQLPLPAVQDEQGLPSSTVFPSISGHEGQEAMRASLPQLEGRRQQVEEEHDVNGQNVCLKMSIIIAQSEKGPLMATKMYIIAQSEKGPLMATKMYMIAQSEKGPLMATKMYIIAQSAKRPLMATKMYIIAQSAKRPLMATKVFIIAHSAKRPLMATKMYIIVQSAKRPLMATKMYIIAQSAKRPLMATKMYIIAQSAKRPLMATKMYIIAQSAKRPLMATKMYIIAQSAKRLSM